VSVASVPIESRDGIPRSHRRSPPPIAPAAEESADTLDLSYLWLTDLPDALLAMTSLTTLNLEANQIGDQGARALAALTGLLRFIWEAMQSAMTARGRPPQLTSLTTLNLSGNRIGADGARALAALNGLTSLNLAGHLTGADGARAIATLTGLTTLNLAGNRIGADGARALAALTGLITLRLGYNEIGADGPTDLFPLMRLTKLETLDLSGCRLQDPVPALWTLPALEYLILHDCVLPGIPAEAISPHSRNCSLKSLRTYFADLERGASEGR
jgi:Leucine-rich repeat (LRR) protein